MTPVEKLEKLRDKVLAWSAYKALCGKDEDSRKLDSFVRELEGIVESLRKTDGILEELKHV